MTKLGHSVGALLADLLVIARIAGTAGIAGIVERRQLRPGWKR